MRRICTSHSLEPCIVRLSAVSITDNAELCQLLRCRSQHFEELPTGIVCMCYCAEESAQENTSPQRVSKFPIFHETNRFVSMLCEWCVRILTCAAQLKASHWPQTDSLVRIIFKHFLCFEEKFATYHLLISVGWRYLLKIMVLYSERNRIQAK
jgi:hypothetical protein